VLLPSTLWLLALPGAGILKTGTGAQTIWRMKVPRISQRQVPVVVRRI
jgi:hypothetical protein